MDFFQHFRLKLKNFINILYRINHDKYARNRKKVKKN